MKIGFKQWISWLGATIAAAMTLTAFAYNNFQTKDEANNIFKILNDRLDRIETKLDLLLEEGNSKRNH